jgi:Bifunctional DNA primase/polymerase, N-terminal/Primase C terminal 2 (PriCT-2)
VLEADTPAGHAVDGIANLAALVHHHKPLPETLTAISPTGSVHRYFEYPKHLKVRTSASVIAPGVDVRGATGMVLAPPTLRIGVGRYTWLNWGTPIAPAPSWLLKLVAKQRRRKRVRVVVCQHPDVALIEAALDAIADDCSRRGAWTYQLWFEICCALQCELGDDGFTLLDSWSSRSPTYKESDCIKKWHLMISASTWLDANQSVQQMTWAPGEVMLIPNRLIADGGWFAKAEATCLNTYRPPIIKPGDASKAGPWLELLKKIYPEEWQHILNYFAQRRQHPEIKPNHSMMLGGAPGIGKDSILTPLKHAVGPWNFADIAPTDLFGPFNPHIRSVVLCISEARDLGDVNRFAFYERTKTLMAAPPDVLRCNEKNRRQYYIVNVMGVIITTNHKTDGIYLPADDRRHFVAWSTLVKEAFAPDYWLKFWHWYKHEDGFEHVVALLDAHDLSDFDCKAPPPRTKAFYDIVASNRAPQELELADALDQVLNYRAGVKAPAGASPEQPDAVTLDEIEHLACLKFQEWLGNPSNRRAIPHRFESVGYTIVRNPLAKDGSWVLDGRRQTVYAKAQLTLHDQINAVELLVNAQRKKTADLVRIGKVVKPSRTKKKVREVVYK